MNLLESADLELFRTILKAPVTKPKETLFLELEVLPLREIIQQRRMNFLFYIIRQKEDSMMSRVFETQLEYRTIKDWITTVLKEIEELNLKVSFVNIKQMSKEDWKNMIKESIVDKAFRNLNEAKRKHSKVMKLEYKNLEMQSFFSPNKLECSQEDTGLQKRINLLNTRYAYSNPS